MKKIVLMLGMFIFALLPQEANAVSPCSTGYSSVQSSWWGPSNDTWYTMCGCQSVKGYSASGSCSGGSGGSESQ